MGTYYGDVQETTGFTEESLKKEIRSVFDHGLAALRLGDDTELAKAKYECLTEVFERAVTCGFPNLDEFRSAGPLQDYVKLIRESRK